MALNKNERLQEWGLIAGDLLTETGRGWWYALIITIVAIIPMFYTAKFLLTRAIVSSYHPPQVIYTEAVTVPLSVMDQKIFSLGQNAYSGYIRIKNVNLEWGTPAQRYTVEFKTLGGTLINRIAGAVFILPASEKLVVFSRFTSQQKPETIQVTLEATEFLRKPALSLTVELERVSFKTGNDATLVSAGIRNLSAFTINQINLPVALYNAKNEVVGVNFTYLNQVRSGETRTFQYVWASPVTGAVRAEIVPEINIFDRNILSTDAGISPFDQQ
ncbi:MAG: hypothetical protein A3J07_01885 [Candidatus Doudnabacteria bacterium RIFCSPLOWO2_02_FULL_49_13]|uniref:Uncharacterized protein n=1 Tax=Candidatus Doudnabacteria bacterium RIFCSPHIGHO2_12_FULL_48_16 TaxID=1817838 RepID=A0A1F5PLE5_9BACT|nr:MAG: hypothetical protein A3B77_00830 [Candidatus Doudnabacteria bacterium RIFCSPHIGHO2_02_FULL_49_24]OGE88791.1 MAG: hypothetical protein A2760_01185 [Candidatus Doudnabacteria bacterium RIFCSPHIGHO2_01_FULL_50_67]OGE90687.1 MAG: hypothetical protein A3E29_00980 [Candidatus Doudnabacteria bacterium RIFCSPHIGHO2_12_FULL_48_16]OGE97018.1 MAG: hypothetical protein A2990_03005 [Candidatus Doudnabacteria bacterium RIFCSPLOWO2_01_FULL_49_40]OGF02552.1 MAG: hypothetical protein A3J07_01885 [Candid